MATQSTAVGRIPRVKKQTGLWSWLTTVDHKRIGIMYAFGALFFFLVGGIEALLIRLQLIAPNQNFVQPETFNQLFTMHGTTMLFLAVMPLTAAFMNYLLPLMIGARDVAFPRLNAFSFWIFVLGGIFINSSWFLGGAPHAAWTGYASLTLNQFSPGANTDFWLLGLQLLGIGTLVSSFNFIVTILNMRAPGMSLIRMPVFVWTTLVTSFLILFSFPVITVALFLIMFDRLFGTVFFSVVAGADVTLWQHLFWIFGHPEVYILIMPAMGIISEILPTFSRKPLFGYSVMVFSSVAIGFMGFSVWSHHMFAIGMGPVAISAFALTTMAIAIPTGVKIFNWVGTLWGGNIRFRIPLLFALGFLAMFLIGGITGVMHSAVPANMQHHDTYFVVAHFHYVIIGGTIFAVFGGFYYWFPKVVGRLMNETLGKWHFWTFFVGFNMTFFPFHFLGLMGMPRRVYTYPAGIGLDFWNAFATVGAFVMAAGVLIFLHNLFASIRNGKECDSDPWDARTLEWAVPTPIPAHNFDEIPKIHARDEFWARKYEGVDPDAPVEGENPALEEYEQEHGIHMPSPSIWPLILAIACTVTAYGLIYSPTFIVGGILFIIVSIFGFAYEGDDGYYIQPKGLSQ